MGRRWQKDEHVEFPHFPSKQKALVSLKGLKNTPTYCSGVILPAVLQ